MSEAPPVALVTAGAAGIGRAIVLAFLEAGYRVHVSDADPAALKALADAHPGLITAVADVADVAAMERLFGSIGRLDVLVNNAGIAGPTGAVEDIAPGDWDRTLGVNLSGAFYAARMAVPLLKAAGGGCIINIASTAGLFGFPFRLPYAAAKWGLVGLTKTLAMELGPFGIRVNAICPGSVEGDRIDGVIDRDAAARGKTADEVRDLYTRQVSMRCFVKPEDVASAALFLASGEAARISGQALAVDGHTETLSAAIWPG